MSDDETRWGRVTGGRVIHHWKKDTGGWQTVCGSMRNVSIKDVDWTKYGKQNCGKCVKEWHQ